MRKSSSLLSARPWTWGVCKSEFVMTKSKTNRNMPLKEQIVVVIAVLITTQSAWALQNYDPSHTTTIFEDAELEEFSYPNAANYTTLVLDTTNNQLLVGAREYIFQINLDNITSFKVIPWKSNNNSKTNCKMRLKIPVDQCYNFVKEIVLTAGAVLVCGTNSYRRSLCSWRNPSDISRNVNLGRTPRFSINTNPHSNNTGILSDLNRFYYGKSKQISSNPSILSTGFKQSRSPLLVVKGDQFLNDPDFVKSFAIGQYIYFFFRETAVENTNCGKVRFSRIARLCKGDVGGLFPGKNLVTFMKARLNCSIPGEFPFYFNEIQDVYWDKRSQTFYAVFSSQPNGLPGSALCAYSMNETEKVFVGDYKVQRPKGSEWRAARNPQHFPNCKIKPESLVSTPPSGSLRKGIMATKRLKLGVVGYLRAHPLMNSAVAAVTMGAQFVLRGVAFTGVAVDEIGGKTVLYVSTDGGSVLRLFTPSSSPTCVLEEIYMYKDNEREVIKSLQIDNRKGALYVGSNGKLIKLKLARCERHRDRKSCVEAHDPYCVWSPLSGACVSRSSVTADDSWIQDLSKCPKPKAKRSGWSEWKTCEQPDGNVCLCRSRNCVGARNVNQCEGSAVQVANCTVLKGKDWSESRWLLEGVIHGGWGPWSNWTECTGDGVGNKVKYRRCNNPAPKNGGAPCIGHDKRKRCCKLKPQVKSKQMWTPYIRMAEKENTAMRFLVSCMANGGEVTNVNVEVSVNKTIDCTNRGKDCYGYEPGVWSKWKDWGPCETVGRMYRTRSCFGKRCIGVNLDEKECVPSAKGTTDKPRVVVRTTIPKDATSWGSWSPCSCTNSVQLVNASMGIRHRVPRCREFCHNDDLDCPRDKVEYQMCLCKGSMEARKSSTPQRNSGRYVVIGCAVAGVLFIVLCLLVTYCFVKKKKNFNLSRRREQSFNEDSSSEKYYAGQNNYPSVSSTKSHGDRYLVEMKEQTPCLQFFTRKEKHRPVFKSDPV